SRWHASCSSRSGALSPPARHCRASSCVRQAEGLGEEHLLTYSALALAFSADCRDDPRWREPAVDMAQMPTERMGPPPGASPPMRMTASWSGSERTYRIQVCGVKLRPNGELPSDLYGDIQQSSSDAGASQKRPLAVHRPSACSGVKALRNTSDAKRQSRQATLAFRSLDPFRALRKPDRRRRDEERPFPLRTKNCEQNPKTTA